MLVYTLLDRKLKVFGQLVVIQNDEGIRRQILESVRGSQSLIERYPEDFDVYCVGTFDQDTGVLVASVPRLVESVGVILRGDQLPLKLEASDGVRETA